MGDTKWFGTFEEMRDYVSAESPSFDFQRDILILYCFLNHQRRSILE